MRTSLVMVWGVLIVAACSQPPPAKFPDHDRVVAAQKAWCAMLSKVDTTESGLSHQKECEAGEPTGSAQYIERMTPCYQQQLQDYGDKAPDSAAIIDVCSNDVLSGADPGDVSKSDVIAARCERMQRCQQLDQASCDGVLERLDDYTKALMTNVYNLKAQAKIAACLRETDCQEDEDRAHDACYAEVRGLKLWLPL